MATIEIDDDKLSEVADKIRKEFGNTKIESADDVVGAVIDFYMRYEVQPLTVLVIKPVLMSG